MKQPTSKSKPNDFTPLWQVAAFTYTARRAAEEFAQTYWDRPRKVIWNEDDSFKVEDGVRTYRVVLKPAREDRPSVYQVGVVN